MAGIYRNQTEGIISLSGDGTTRITIADKNLGATGVGGYGYFYQRGNNYGFPNSGGVTTSSTQVDANNYGPGNYYSSSTFIVRSSSPYNWDSSDNDNLRGGETGTVEAMQGPCDSGFHIPSKDERSSVKTILTALGIDTSNGDGMVTYLKMSLAGIRYNDTASVGAQGSVGYYWSSTPKTDNKYAYVLIISSSQFLETAQNRSNGEVIRPFKNDAVIPYANEGWTKLYGDDLPPRPVPTINRFIKNGDYFYFKDAPIHTSGVTLDTNEIKFKNPGETYQLTATITPAGAIEQSVIWSSSDTSIATVDQTGLVTCVTPGECTITATCGGYSATCSVVASKYVDFLLVGGGGGGGYYYHPYGYFGGGGGGAGGYISCSDYDIQSGSYSIVVGAGGACGTGEGAAGCNGGNSTFNGLTAYGGGRGGGGSNNGAPACSGGSGGGAGSGAGYCCWGGSGCAGQGNDGGKGGTCGGAGGGGAGAAGSNGGAKVGGAGGVGIQNDISGTSVWYSGGGGGGSTCYTSYPTDACGSLNTCCGGGGRGCTYGMGTATGGGRGVFILRYKTGTISATGGTCYTCGDYTIHCFTSNGTLTVN